MQPHIQAVRWRQVHAKARGGTKISEGKDTLENQKPEHSIRTLPNNNGSARMSWVTSEYYTGL